MFLLWYWPWQWLQKKNLVESPGGKRSHFLQAKILLLDVLVTREHDEFSPSPSLSKPAHNERSYRYDRCIGWWTSRRMEASRTWIGHRPFEATLPLLFFGEDFATPEAETISRAWLDLVFLILVRAVGLLQRDIFFVFLVAALVEDEPADCNLSHLGGCFEFFKTVFEWTMLWFGFCLLLVAGS